MSSELRALAENATPGPWALELHPSVPGAPAMAFITAPTGHVMHDEADAAYIAAASPDVILRLLDERDAAIRRAEEPFCPLAVPGDGTDAFPAQRCGMYRGHQTAHVWVDTADFAAALRSQESQKPPEAEDPCCERERELRDERVSTAHFHVAHDGTVRHPATCHDCRALEEQQHGAETPA